MIKPKFSRGEAVTSWARYEGREDPFSVTGAIPGARQRCQNGSEFTVHRDPSPPGIEGLGTTQLQQLVIKKCQPMEKGGLLERRSRYNSSLKEKEPSSPSCRGRLTLVSHF